jgi:hypothetical protein
MQGKNHHFTSVTRNLDTTASSLTRLMTKDLKFEASLEMDVQTSTLIDWRRLLLISDMPEPFKYAILIKRF